jgi:hypothetical protein
MQGKHKANDVFAVELFSIDNLVTLLSLSPSEIDPSEVEYVSPFIPWSYAISVADLSMRAKLDLLKIALQMFLKWAPTRIPSSGQLLSQLYIFAIPETDCFLHGGPGSRAVLEQDCLCISDHHRL